MHWALSKYSKKRQNDLSGFTSLILMVVYTSHLNACLWLWIGQMYDCLTDEARLANEGKDNDDLYTTDSNLVDNCT